ncbi:Pre-mRNA-splicing factor Cwf15/Cwc15 [Fennellomyces sp. T-0311]|nr:Pre-mRNA-splicing factor Cwf15/Cwc15 [Fennellomyces sp. T-0311]
MTTAARPTFDPARGNDSKAPSFQYSSRDLASHTKLKFRQPGQGTTDEIGDRERLKEELRQAEREYYESKENEKNGGSGGQKLIGQGDEDAEARRQKLLEEAEKMAELDKDQSDSESDSGGSDSSRWVLYFGLLAERCMLTSFYSDEESDDDDEDNTAELLATLQKIRKERAEEKERQEREKLDEEEAQRQEEAMTGNPLLQLGEEKRDFSVKRRWDDDVIFKNQARGADEKNKKRFVNDMLRSDFHRRFLTKYIH